MDIRFISSLTPDDENQIGPALLGAVAALLDRLPLTYTLRIETVGGRAFQHGHSPESDGEAGGAENHGPPIVLERRRAG